MKQLTLFFLLAGALGALLLPLRPQVARAQLEETPILGEPVVMTPLVTSAPAPSSDTVFAPSPEDSTDVPAAATTPPTTWPDACEPNDTPTQACALPLDTVSGPFTVVPEADQDFFRLDLPQEPSIQTTITVRATERLDLALSARRGDALVASGSYSLTLAPDVAGPIVLRVENRDPRPAAGEQYRIEIRREIVPPQEEAAGAGDTPAPDVLENNWSFDTAAPVAVGVVYDLTFACPDPRPNACPGGDHDYLLVPVKAGVHYLLTTFDLDPGVDTVIELFWGSTTAATAGNDDYAPGGTLSALSWSAPDDGLLAVRVAPRNGGLPQHLHENKAGYRFAVAPEASELARKLLATIRQQANVPTPTVAPATSPAGAPATGGSSSTSGSSSASGGGSPPAGGNSGQETIAAGPAIITSMTVLRREPSERSAALAELAPDTPVSVRGPVSGLWVSVETEASILPGWVRWSDLRRAELSGDTSTAPDGTATVPTPQQPGAAGETNSPSTPALASPTPGAGDEASGHEVVVQALDPVLPPPPPVPLARVPFTLSVVVVATDRPLTGGAALGFATPTPDLRQPVAQVRVQLVNVFGDLLAEGLTDAQGAIQLRRDIRPGDALAVRVPAWGVELPLAADQSRLVVTIPEA